MYDEVLLGELHMPLKTLCFEKEAMSMSVFHNCICPCLCCYWSLNSSLVQTKKWREKETKEGGKEKKLTDWRELLTFFSLAYFALWSGG